MSIIKGYIREEVERLDRMERRIVEAIASLPPGTVQKRVIHGREYGYLKFYEAGKTKQKYLGPYNGEVVQGFILKIKERKNHEETLARIHQDKSFGNKALSVILKPQTATRRINVFLEKNIIQKD